MAHKVYLALLWHQHQPFYKNLKTGSAIMPWVRLHATKDYFDMAAMLDHYPKIRMTINLVPSLLVQLQDFAENRCTDPWLEKTLIPAGELTENDQIWILEHFFYCNWDTMICPNARFAELLEKRGKFASGEDLRRTRSYFKKQDFLDLQVWFNLAWMDPHWQEKDPLVSSLFKKGKGFSEDEKLQVIEKQREICRLTIAKHKELWHKGQLEISTTPFYHPILPLLCDTNSAQISMPGSLKPKKVFRHPEDAKAQVEKSLAFMEKIFDKRPVGMWPSEGSISEQAIAILAECGIKWAATDEGVLFHSLQMEGTPAPREALYSPYRVETKPGGATGNKLQMVFRDHALSDAIGFIYARMDARNAVEDFIGRICKIADSIPDAPAESPPLIPVILDGENCWESYYRDGTDFLNLLYKTLSHHPRIETTTVGGFIERYPARKTLRKLWAGSWINSDFAIWIGHPEDNRAWDLLGETRDHLIETISQNPALASEPATQLAWESLYIAEGSDWCWWYGDQNSTAQDEMFDDLFRSHLKNTYHFLGQTPPQKLNIAIKAKTRKHIFAAPVGLVTAKIDGLVTNYYEWRPAGTYQTDQAGGAMHQAENFLTAIHFGFDLEKLYLRLDTKVSLKSDLMNEFQIKIAFLEPARHRVQIHWQNHDVRGVHINAEGLATELKEIAAKKIIEFALPFSFLQVNEGDAIELAISVEKAETTLERWPYNSSIRFKRPTREFGSDIWSA